MSSSSRLGREVNATLDRLQSSKVKDRSEAVETIRQWVSDQRMLDAIGDALGGWSELLQHLFTVMINERNDHVNKPKTTATATKRLEELAELVADVSDKIHRFADERTVKSLIKHFSQLLSRGGMPTVATVAYLRALKSLLQHAPHLERLKPQNWKDLVATCFCLFFGRKLQDGETFMGDQELLDDSENLDERFNQLLAVAPRNKQASAQEDFELVSCIESLLRSTTAPVSAFSRAIFINLLEVVACYARETKVHLPTFGAINIIFDRLELNHQTMVKKLSPFLLGPLTRLWQTKSTLLKAHLIIAARYVLQQLSDVANRGQIDALYEKITAEGAALQWKESLALFPDTLSLQWDKRPPHAVRSKPFACRTARMSTGFEDKHATAWLLLELTADILSHLHHSSERGFEKEADGSDESRSPAKRRKKTSAFSEIVESLRDTHKLRSSTSWGLQVLFFFVENHWQHLDLSWRRTITSELVQLLHRDDSDIISWSAITLAAIVASEEGLKERSYDWRAVWLASLRRLSILHVDRCVAHLALVLMDSDSRLDTVFGESVLQLARDIAVQGPTFPSDTVCDFLSRCLDRVANDAQLLKSDLHHQCFLWLSGSWSSQQTVQAMSFSQDRPAAERLSSKSLAHLACNISGLPAIAVMKDRDESVVLPDCPASTHATHQANTWNVRQYVMRCEVPQELAAIEGPVASNTCLPSQDMVAKVSAWFRRTFRDALATEPALGDAFWSQIETDALTRLIDMAVTVVLFSTAVNESGLKSDEQLLSTVASILVKSLRGLEHKRMSTADVTAVLASLEPLLLTLSELNDDDLYPVLLRPGQASGLPSNMLRKNASSNDLVEKAGITRKALATVWATDHLAKVSSALKDAGEALLASLVSSSSTQGENTQAIQGRLPRSTAAAADPFDDFDDDVEMRPATVEVSPTTSPHALAYAVASCIRALATASFAHAHAGTAVACPDVIVELLDSIDGEDAVVIIRELCRAVRAGVTTLGLGHAERLLEYIGDDLLTDYHFALDESVALVGLDFLSVTLNLWVDSEETEATVAFGNNARGLCAWYTRLFDKNQLCSWRVRLAFSLMLEAYLRIDPRQQHWSGTEDIAYKDHDKGLILPTDMIASLLEDEDFCVRVHATSATTSLFELAVATGVEALDPFQKILRHRIDRVSWIEGMQTQLLCSANTVIASEERRRATYWYLVSKSCEQVDQVERIVRVLEGVVARLELGSLARMHSHYANYFQFMRDKDSTTLDQGAIHSKGLMNRDVPAVYGYKTLRDLRRKDFPFVTAWCLLRSTHAYGDTELRALSEVTGISVTSLVRRSLGNGIALKIVECFAHLRDPATLQAALDADFFLASLEPEAGRSMLAAQSGRVLAEILKAGFPSPTNRWSSAVAINLLGNLSSPEAAQTLRAIFPDVLDMKLVEALPPILAMSEWIKALAWTLDFFEAHSKPDVVYGVLQHVFEEIDDLPFLDWRRYRLLNLTVYLAMSSKGVKNSAVLALLSKRLISLYQLTDLLLPVLQLLRWSIQQWIGASSNSSAAWPDVFSSLLEAAQLTHAHLRQEASEPVLQQLSAFATFLNQVFEALAKRGSSQSSMPSTHLAMIRMLWPTASIEQTAFASTASGVLRLVSESKANVSLVPLLQVLSRTAQGFPKLEMQQIVWWLVNRITIHDCLDKNDCLALATLVRYARADLPRPPIAELASYVARTLPLAFKTDDAKSAIGLTLLELLMSSTAHNGPTLFSAARAILSSCDAAALMAVESSSIQRLTGDVVARAGSLDSSDQDDLDALELADLLKPDWQVMSQHWEPWICSLASCLLLAASHYDSSFVDVAPAVKSDHESAWRLLDHLVHLLLHLEAEEGHDTVQKTLSAAFSNVLKTAEADRRCLAAIIRVVLTLRQRQRPTKAGLGGSDTWLKIPFPLLADAAIRVEAPYAALLFLELANDHRQLAKVTRQTSELATYRLVQQAYDMIDEPDGAFGHENPNVHEAVLAKYVREADWQETFAFSAADVETGSQANGSLLVKSLGALGLSNLSALTKEALSTAKSKFSQEDVYDNAWRAGIWSLPVPQIESRHSSINHYAALRALHVARTPSQAIEPVDKALVVESSSLCFSDLDGLGIRETNLASIVATQEIHDWCSLADGHRRRAESPLSQVLPSDLGFHVVESIISTRVSVLEAVRAQERTEQIGDELSPVAKRATRAQALLLTELSRRARADGKKQASLSAVTHAYRLCTDLDANDARTVEEEFANVLWSRGEASTAIRHLTQQLSLAQKSSQDADELHIAVCLARLGEWNAQARLQSAQDIVETYFEPAVERIESIADDIDHSRDVGAVHGAFATFADRQHEALQALIGQAKHLTSRYDASRSTSSQNAGESASVRRALTSKSERQRAATQKEDEDRLLQRQAESSRLLHLALDHYGKALTCCDTFDEKVSRFLALWLARPGEDDIVGVVGPHLEAIPSWKFVFLAHQLSARMTTDGAESAFMRQLLKLVTRICVDHPFQTLLPVYSLRQVDAGGSSRSQTLSSGSRRTSRQSDRRSSTPMRRQSAIAAEQVFDNVRARPGMSDIVQGLETLCEAAREWTLVEAEKKQKKKRGLVVPSSQSILTLARHLAVPPLTLEVPVDPTCNYDDVPKVTSYNMVYDVAGGNSKPKIMTCVDDQGNSHRELFKKADDIRQDAVMEQVFVMMNKLLATDVKTSKRKLRIRTYKVVPLQQSTGIIEHVGNTVSLGDLLKPLYQKSGARIQPDTAMTKMKEAGEYLKQNGHADEAKEKVKELFKTVLADMPPVLRHAFYQRHKTPALWFDSRLNYTRSVATTSIGGHILGLGDRHASNILVDETTGELVHIDLGIAFDQGRRLAIPELVPFRLTQNIIDGFGMNGIDGVFRRCAEETLRVLRERSDVILMILEVFKHDPLQQWALSPEMAKHAQGSDDGGTFDVMPDDADRALAMVAEKLDNRLSIEQNINELVQRATQVEHLAFIFHGWQGYL